MSDMTEVNEDVCDMCWIDLCDMILSDVHAEWCQCGNCPERDW